jgi:hypothetical protein
MTTRYFITARSQQGFNVVPAVDNKSAKGNAYKK